MNFEHAIGLGIAGNFANHLKQGDEVYVLVYDKRVDKPDLNECKTKIILKQIVE